ncbi:hypothetical protein PSPTO_4757 [Pseudomonas syringae pv. tomato str. DC3000]|uniref:Uncharacterized protein n=1 Tax=Pseudomonas syringae pv. tomato (strain ATCC BAA-871 / DC3000) TaxID=223283 RepID=Q87W22_PSESM|nr:hypothetical protein PSPTO_4757 [Pseudomonas syringae pv. tomato str. DC3000]
MLCLQGLNGFNRVRESLNALNLTSQGILDLSKPPWQNRDLKKLGGLREVAIKRHDRSNITWPRMPTVPQPFFQ